MAARGARGRAARAGFGVRGAPFQRAAVHRGAAVHETGQGRDHGLRVGRDQLRPKHHGVDVFFGVVVGQDRAAQVGGRAGGAQVARGGEHRVDGVVGVGVAGFERVHAVGLPGFGHELHPPDRAGARHRLVGAVVGLDFVDAGEDLPRHAVLDGCRLVDRQHEERHAVERERLGRGLRGGEDRGERAGLGDGLRRAFDAVGAVAGLALAGRAACGGAALRAAGGLLAALHRDRGRFRLGRGRLRGRRRTRRGRDRRRRGGGVTGRRGRRGGFARDFGRGHFRRGRHAADVGGERLGRDGGRGERCGRETATRKGPQNSTKSSAASSGGRRHAVFSFICGSSHMEWSAHRIHVTGYAHRESYRQRTKNP